MDSVEQTKACTKCGEVKALGEFSKRTMSRDGLQSRCKTCSRKDHAAGHAKHKSKRNAARRSLRASDPQFRARDNAAKSAWYHRNKDHATATIRAWQAANPERVKATATAAHARRRASKAQMAVYEISVKDMRRLLSSPCAVPGCMNTNLHVDHIIAVSRGGSHGIGNLQMLCQHHNIAKHKRTWVEFMAYLRRPATKEKQHATV